MRRCEGGRRRWTNVPARSPSGWPCPRNPPGPARVRNMPSRDPRMTSKGLGRGVVRSYTGALLVALPALQYPHFERTVVFLLAHEADGALGVVLNRPTG